MRKNLVFSSVGNHSCHRWWLDCSQERGFDLWLYFYGDGHGYPDDADYYVRRRGTKSQNFVHVYDARQEDLLGYRYVFIVDDDIQISGNAINRLFASMERYDLWQAQPAFTPDSHITTPITAYDHRFVLRYTNFCEIGVLALRTDFLHLLCGLYRESVTGNSVDRILPKLLGYPHEKIAVVDDVVCRHPYRDSEMDRVLSREKQMKEGRDLMRRYRAKMRYRIYGGVARHAGHGFAPLERTWINLHGATNELVETGPRFWKPLVRWAGAIKRLVMRART